MWGGEYDGWSLWARLLSNTTGWLFLSGCETPSVSQVSYIIRSVAVSCMLCHVLIGKNPGVWKRKVWSYLCRQQAKLELVQRASNYPVPSKNIATLWYRPRSLAL
jgi:hypothetical protein